MKLNLHYQVLFILILERALQFYENSQLSVLNEYSSFLTGDLKTNYAYNFVNYFCLPQYF
jgi:hypothetical protein